MRFGVDSGMGRLTPVVARNQENAVSQERQKRSISQQRRDPLLGETSPHKSDPQVDSIEPDPGRPFFGIQTPSNIVARRF